VHHNTTQRGCQRHSQPDQRIVAARDEGGWCGEPKAGHTAHLKAAAHINFLEWVDGMELPVLSG